jgi:iron complex transport system substrate-binding protein
MSETMISLAEKVQEQINIPVIVVDGQLEKLHESYIFLGDLLGQKEKADELGTYCKITIENVVDEVKKIPEDDRIRIFYSEGATGLETDAKGSPHTQVIDLVGGINVL